MSVLEDGLTGVVQWLITMVSKPLSCVVPLPNGLFMAYKWWLLATYKSWDDPPSCVIASQPIPFQRTIPLKSDTFC